jgi:hypothetical protein
VGRIFNGLDQAKVAFLDHVQKLHPAADIPHLDGDHQAQMASARRMRASSPSAMRRARSFLVGRQKLHLAISSGTGGPDRQRVIVAMRGFHQHFLGNLLHVLEKVGGFSVGSSSA